MTARLFNLDGFSFLQRKYLLYFGSLDLANDDDIKLPAGTESQSRAEMISWPAKFSESQRIKICCF